MQNYILMTDSDSDLPYALKVQYDIPVVYMPYTLDGKEGPVKGNSTPIDPKDWNTYGVEVHTRHVYRRTV